MKHSIKKIFQGLNTYLFFVLFIAFLTLMLTLEQQLSFDKVDNLKNQKKLIASLTKIKKDDIEIALIQFNGKSTQLLQEINKLKVLYKYNYLDQYLLENQQEYFDSLNKLEELTKSFNNAAHEYYVEGKDKKLEKKTKRNLDRAFYKINHQIDQILLKTVDYDEQKFVFFKNIIIAAFALMLLATLYYRKALYSIYKDLEFLLYLDKKSKITFNIYSTEVDAIALRMNRKTVTTDNPSFLDPVTDINNYKGLINSYSVKKAKSSNFTSITVLEIDNFSKTNRPFSQDIAQGILKKVAYTISLHEQPIDTIARTDYNQFTVILSRATKEQTYKDAELIRESIAELKFNIPGQGPVQITVSGGHVIKPTNTSIEEGMKQAKEILAYAKSTAKNKILQAKDLAQKEMYDN
ncbi:GGDEF domain-containing protein [Sulfurimonas sp.]